MIFAESLFMALCAYLWQEGGQKRAWARDIVIPIILALFLALKFKTWWLFLSIGATSQIIKLGYGAYDPQNDPEPSLLALLTHDRNGWYIRAIWGLIAAFLIGSSLFFGGFVPGWGIISFIVINALINYLVCRLRLSVLPTDILVGLGISSIVLLASPFR